MIIIAKWPIRVLVLSFLLVGLTSGCNHFVDRTHDPAARFGLVAGRCFITKVDLFLIDYGPQAVPNTSGYAIAPPSNGDPVSDMPASTQEYFFRTREYWEKSGGPAAPKLWV